VFLAETHIGYESNKSASFLIAQTNKQTKKEPPPKKNKKNTHTIVGREKWLLYFQV
jgi:hypothetical protein